MARRFVVQGAIIGVDRLRTVRGAAPTSTPAVAPPSALATASLALLPSLLTPSISSGDELPGRSFDLANPGAGGNNPKPRTTTHSMEGIWQQQVLDAQLELLQREPML